MGCAGCLGVESAKAGQRFIACFRQLLGLGHGDGVWDEEAHTMMYRALGNIASVRENRGMDAAGVAAIPFGAEPVKTAQYISVIVGVYAQDGDDPFWGCLGIGRLEGFQSASRGEGLYYDHLRSAMTQITNTESGRSQMDSGTPWWMWLLLAGGVGLAGYAIYRWTK
jgi:hypothetical protein